MDREELRSLLSDPQASPRMGKYLGWMVITKDGPLIHTWDQERESLLVKFFKDYYRKKGFKKRLRSLGLSIERVSVIVMPITD